MIEIIGATQKNLHDNVQHSVITMISKSNIVVVFMIFLFAATSNSASCQETLNHLDASDTSLVTQLNDSARSLINSSPETSRLLLKKAITISDALQFYSGKARSYNTLGILSYQRGSLDSAEYYFGLALKEWEVLDNRKQVSNLLGNLSIILAQQNKLTEAIAYNKRSLELKLAFKDTIPIANGFNNLGNLYMGIGNTKDALYFQRKALKLRKAINDSMRLSSSYTNLGALYNLTGDLDSAHYFGRKALELQIKNNNKWGMANSYGVLAEFYYLKNSTDSAMIYLDKSLALVEELGLADLLEEMSILQAKVFMEQNELGKALQSITSQEKYSNTNLSISAFKILAQIYQKKGDNKQSALYYEKYNLRNDSVQKINQENKIADITANHFYELRGLELKNKQDLKEDKLEQVIVQKQEIASRLWLIIILIGLLLAMSIWFSFSIKRKNEVLNKQREKIDKLIIRQKETIETRTTELLSSKNAISRYAFLNSHELRAPLSKVLSIINLSDQEDIGGDAFFKSLKISAEELEVAIREISNELNKGS